MTKKQTDNNKSLKRLRTILLFGYALIIILVTVFISTLALDKTGDVLKIKSSIMTSSLNVQMKLNMNSYLSRIETTGTLVFAEEEIYLYDASAESDDEYEELSTEKTISDKLYDISIMENFVDFGIVYSNNHTLGKISNGTKELFGDALYTDLSSFIDRERTDDGWYTGYNDNYKRIYYVNRINENAVLTVSVYSSELERIFEHPGGFGDVSIRLTTNNDVIVYSSEEDEVGKTMPEEIMSRVSDRTSATFIDDQYLITVNSCDDEWKIICSVPTEAILMEMNDIKIHTVIIGVLSAVIAITLSIIFSMKLSNPLGDMVSTLNKKACSDLLTGVLNKRSFEETVDMLIKNASPDSRYAVMLFDVDNFKGVNDTLGHAYGDKVLANIGDMMRKIFRSEDILGRLGGDEFCVCINVTYSDYDEVIKVVEMKCTQLCEEFHHNYTGSDNSYKISASIGAAISPFHGNGFSELYSCADKALYKSKSGGKDSFTIYTEELSK